jgi:competence protein ComFC
VASLRDFMYPPITKGAFEQLRAMTPKRICFGSAQKKALKLGDGKPYAGAFNVPFRETISTIFPWKLFENKKGEYGGYWLSVKDNAEFESISSWLTEHSDLIFIRSLLNTSVAMCAHYETEAKRSDIGALEHAAKWSEDVEARNKLASLMIQTFRRIHSSNRIDMICAVPSSKPLSRFLASRLSAETGIPDSSASLSWGGPKAPIKEMTVVEKWDMLSEVGLVVDADVTNKRILIVDDMYQSGTTVHFVASMMRERGATELHCLAVSKARGDTDNQ